MRRSHGDGWRPRPSFVPAGGRHLTADVRVRRSQQVKVFEGTSPLVEGLSIDEAFLDVRGLERISGTPTEIAARLRREIREGVGLPISVGVARTKFLAKVASGVSKPDDRLVVPPDGELTFLHPLPVERLWGVGAVTARKLRERGIATVGEVAQCEEAALVSMLGRAAGRHLHALAHNRDPLGARGSPSALDRGAARPQALTEVVGGARGRPRGARRPRRAQTTGGPASLSHGRASAPLR